MSSEQVTKKAKMFLLDHVQQTFEIFFPSDSPAEIRLLGAQQTIHEEPRTFTGYFRPTYAKSIGIKLGLFKTWKGAYFIFNSLAEEHQSKSIGHITTAKAGSQTTNAQIETINWLFVDLDYKRESGTPTTDDQHYQTLQLAESIKNKSIKMGLPAPVICDSGNGAHLWWKVSLSKLKEKLIQRVLAAMNKEFSTDTIDVDCSVFSLAQLTKLYGTLVCKGDDPNMWRYAKILEVPEEIILVTEEKLEQIAIPESDLQTGTVSSAGKSISEIRYGRKKFILDVPAWMKRNGISFKDPKAYFDGKLWEWTSESSPFCVHDAAKKHIFQLGNGAVGAGCQHDSCKWGWPQLKKRFQHNEPSPEPEKLQVGRKVKCGDRGNVGTVKSVLENNRYLIQWMSPEGVMAERDLPITELRDFKTNVKLDGTRPDFDILSLKEMSMIYPGEQEVVIPNLIRPGEVMNLISGSKMRKTWTLLGLSMSMAAGIHWLDFFPDSPLKVLYIDPEVQAKTIRSRCRIIAEAYELDMELVNKNFKISSLRLHNLDYHSICAGIMEFGIGFDLIIFDSIYKLWPEGDDENSVQAWNKLNNALVVLADDLYAGIVVSHHSTKGEQGSKSVMDVGSGSSGQGRTADAQVVMRPHALGDGDLAVIEGIFRSFSEPMRPLTIKFENGIWVPKAGIEAIAAGSDRAKESSRIQKKINNEAELKEKDEKKEAAIRAIRMEIVKCCLDAGDDGATMHEIRKAVNEAKGGKPGGRASLPLTQKFVDELVNEFELTAIQVKSADPRNLEKNLTVYAIPKT